MCPTLFVFGWQDGHGEMLSILKRRAAGGFRDGSGLLRRPIRSMFGILIALALVAPALTARAEAAYISTLFNSDNNGAPGGAVFFNLTVGPKDISITRFDTNEDAIGTFAGFQIYTRLGSAFGSESDAGLWNFTAFGTVTGLGVDAMSPVFLNNHIDLSAGTTYGFALLMPAGVTHYYTNTGSDGALASYANMDLTLDFGTAQSLPFFGAVYDPRTWNGTIYYNTPSAVPLPAAAWLFLSALGGLGVFGWRRRVAA